MQLSNYQAELFETLKGVENISLQDQVTILGSDTREAQVRLAVYQNNYAHSLTEALKATYPVILRLIGEDLFTALALDYVKQSPPTTASLLEYGEDFINHVVSHPACKELHYLVDVGQIEWCYLQCFHGPDLQSINMHHLLAHDEDDLAQLSFSWHPNCYLLSSDYPSLTIWEANLEEEVEEINLSEAEPSRLLLYRNDELQVVPMQLHPFAYNFCQSLADGQTISMAWQTIQAQLDTPLPEEELYQLLSFLLQLPVFTDITLNRG
jgi:hypothetical protein